MIKKLAIIGFGEAGQTFAKAARWESNAIVFDLKTLQVGNVSEKLQDMSTLGVDPGTSNQDAVSKAPYVLSLVTADQAFSVAAESSKCISEGSFFFDMNSVSPDSKMKASKLIEQAGAHYIDTAIMAPVIPKYLDVPILVSGPQAQTSVNVLNRLGFSNVKYVGPQTGRASSIKMLRSIMVKGMEALTAECVIAAEKAGVLEEVLSALGDDWVDRADYNLDRIMIHGERRAAEMDEVVKTLSALDMPCHLTAGTAAHQRNIGELKLKSPPDTLQEKIKLINKTRGS